MFHGKNILAVGSHPDDIEFGALGTLLKFCSESKIFCYIATLGGKGDTTDPDTRRKESVLALKVLNPMPILWSSEIGLDVAKYHEYVKSIEDVILAGRIDTIFTPSRHDTHQDHRFMNEVTMTASRRFLTSIFCYSTPSVTLDFNPRLFVDITEVFQKKCEALKLHKTQLNKPYMDDKYLERFHSDISGGYVERFEIERCIIR